MPTRAQSYRLRQIHATLARVYDELIRLCAFFVSSLHFFDAA